MVFDFGRFLYRDWQWMLVVSSPCYVRKFELMIVSLRLEVSCLWHLVAREGSTLLSGLLLEM
jgi:hypothetical protein